MCPVFTVLEVGSWARHWWPSENRSDWGNFWDTEGKGLVFYCQDRRQQFDGGAGSGEIATSCFLTQDLREKRGWCYQWHIYTSLDSLQGIFIFIVSFDPYKRSFVDASIPTLQTRKLMFREREVSIHHEATKRWKNRMTSWGSDLFLHVHFPFIHQAADNMDSGAWLLTFNPASPLTDVWS